MKRALKYILKWIIGWGISRKFIKGKSRLCVIVDGHIGEAVYTCSLLPEFMKLKKDVSEIIIITRHPYDQITCLYRSCYKKVYSISPHMLSCLETYADSNLNFQNIHWGWQWDDNIFQNDVPDVYIAGFYYKVKAYSIPYSTKHSLITDPINENDRELNDFLKKNEIIKNRSVILIPRAQSARMLPVEDWERIANLLINNGYKVFTNVKDNSEQAIIGTVPIEIPLRLAISVVDYCGLAISVRCGLTDLLAVGNCKVDTLYNIKDKTDETLAGIWSWKLGVDSVLNKRKYFIKNEKDFVAYLNYVREEYTL